MKKGLTVLLVLFCIGMAGLFGYIRTTSDRTAPKIHVENAKDVVYTEGMDTSELLEGITASDDKDGDVTDSVVVESIFPSKDGSSVTIVYAAKDSSNNVGKANRKISLDKEESSEEETQDMQPEEEQEAFEGQPEADAETNAPAGSEEVPQDAENQPETVPAEGESTEDDTIPQEQKAAMDALLPQQPKLYLTEYQVTLKAGSSFDSLGYVKEITDDTDSREELFRRIQVNGSVDIWTAGTYQVNYTVVDSQGNSSNTATLTVVVN